MTVSPFDDGFQALSQFVDGVQASNLNAQNMQVSAITSAYRNPTWVCHYPLGDVTFPECFLLVFTCNGITRNAETGSTLAQTAGTAHTHGLLNTHYHSIVGADVVAGLGNGVAASAIGFVLVPDDAYGAFVTISQTMIMDTVGVTWAKNVGTLNNVYLEIFKQNADLTLTRIWVSSDVSASIGSSAYASFETAVSPAILTQAGEVYLLRVRNSSTVANNVSVAGHPRSTISPGYSFSCSTAAATNRTSYTAAENSAARNCPQMPWMMLASVGQAVTPQQYNDDFNRSALGSIWLTKSNTGSNQLKISSNRIVFDGLTGGAQNALYTRSCVTDNMLVQGTISGTLLAVLGQELGFLMHSNADMSSLVYLAVGSGGAKIYSGSSTSLTQRATISRLFNDGLWSLQYDTTTTTYTALKDGADVGLSWNDSGAAKPRGDGYRYGGMRISLSTLIAAGQIDNWLLRDRAM